MEKLVTHHYRAKRSIVLVYDVHSSDNEANSSRLMWLLKKITIGEITRLPYATSDVPQFSKQITSALADVASTVRGGVSVDISSFNTGAIIQTLDFLFRSQRYGRIRVMYTEPVISYPKTTPKTTDEEVLSSGLKEVLTIPEFSGIYTPGYSPMLIIFLGFEPIRARGILELFQPSRKIGIIGVPDRADLKWRVDLAKTLYRNFFESPEEMLELSEGNYIEVYEALESLYSKFAETNNIAIAPLGTKMQTLAVFLFLREHPDVQLLLSIPLKYDPRRYTEGSGKSYQIVFHL